ncbi:MAG: hypothetical protein ACOYCB_02195 [Fastidiosipilaceae bacterium]|nr:hypothetical protein [Clostridiaceae bacterium]
MLDRQIQPFVITAHTGWSDDLEFVFRHKDKLCNPLRKLKLEDPDAPYDAYNESDDTEENIKTRYLSKVKDRG